MPPGAPQARVDRGSADWAYLSAAVNSLVGGNETLSVSVVRDGAKVYGAASGATVDGSDVNTDTAFVLASVSKLVTALSIARLAERGLVDLAGAVPWDKLGLRHHAAWNDVTVRELLAHTSGMPVARKSWLDLPGSCAVPLTAALAEPPAVHRGRWTYSNGNYCALGLLVEYVTGKQLDNAARLLVFDPIGVTGPHLTTAGAKPFDAPYAKGLGRLDRLGGAGTWMASTNDVARMMSAVTIDDMDTLVWPGIMIDQYGWGHTGTVDGAKACTWVLDGGRTVIAAAVSGNVPSSGSELCDVLVPALAVDVGLYAGDPIRSPL